MNRAAAVFALVGSLFAVACAAPAEDDVNASVETDVTDPALKELPPIIQLPPSGGSSGGTSGGGTCQSGNNQCFGAIGMNCDGVLPNHIPVPQVEGLFHAGCLDGWCFVNAGSWAHDECCFTTPTGRWCGGPLSANNAGCVVSWDRAVHRVSHGLNWRRRVDMCRVDTDGLVNFAEYCAPNGTIVASNDANRCCSGLSRPYNAATDSHIAEAQGTVFDGTFTPVVCAAPPSAPPKVKTCLSNAQCAADEICIDPSNVSGTQKYCLKM